MKQNVSERAGTSETRKAENRFWRENRKTVEKMRNDRVDVTLPPCQCGNEVQGFFIWMCGRITKQRNKKERDCSSVTGLVEEMGCLRGSGKFLRFLLKKRFTVVGALARHRLAGAAR